MREKQERNKNVTEAKVRKIKKNCKQVDRQKAKRVNERVRKGHGAERERE